MPTFTPPTVRQAASGDRLFGRYGVPVGQSVVRIPQGFGTGPWGETPFGFGGYRLMPYPALAEIAGLVEGEDWFQGGRTYIVSDEIAAALEADGFTVEPDLGYGESEFGSQGYGV